MSIPNSAYVPRKSRPQFGMTASRCWQRRPDPIYDAGIAPRSRAPPLAWGLPSAAGQAHAESMDVSSKLQLKPGQSVAVLNAPPGLVLPEVVAAATAAARADRLAWIGYPKGGQLGTDLNRDRLRRGAGGPRRAARPPGVNRRHLVRVALPPGEVARDASHAVPGPVTCQPAGPQRTSETDDHPADLRRCSGTGNGGAPSRRSASSPRRKRKSPGSRPRGCAEDAAVPAEPGRRVTITLCRVMTQ